MTNKSVEKTFRTVADLLQIQDADSFRVRSYQRAADTIAGLTEDLADIQARGELIKLPGIGATLAEKIEELLDTGQLRFMEELLEEVPPGLLDVIEIPEVGPKSARRLWLELDVVSVDDLEKVAQAQEIRKLKGFGAKKEEKILHNLEIWRQGQERSLAAVALEVAEPLLAMLRDIDGVECASLAGSLRRGRETTKDVDLLAAAEDSGPALDALVAHELVADVIGRGDTKASVRLEGGLNADLRVVPPASWGAALQYFTGSKAHNIAVRSRARERGLTINESGVFKIDDPEGEPVAAATEQDVYAAVGLPWIPPELREDRGEVKAAEDGELPELLELDQIRGDLHCHSTWSDGRHTIVEMARAARDRGYLFHGVCDHSKSLTVANGLDERRVRRQWSEIAEAQDEVPEVRLLRGIEVDILSDGTLDLDLDLLSELDLVVASVHSVFGQDPKTMTARLLAAIETGVVNILGHPTGRLINRREGYTFDFDTVVAAAVEHGVALELNAAPERLDLDDVLARRARQKGAMLSINSDAHRRSSLAQMRYGVSQARRAWLVADDILNTKPLDELLVWLKD